MADQVAVVTFTTPATTGTFPITSSSITEAFSAAILIFTRQTTDDANVNHGVLGVGFIGVNGSNANSDLQCSVAISLENGLTSGQDCDTSAIDNQCIRAPDGTAAGVLSIVAVYSASIAGGVELNFTTVTGGIQAKCTAILFAGLAKAVTGGCSFLDSASSHEDTGVGVQAFQPDLVIFRAGASVVTGDTSNGTLALGFALNKAGIPQVSAYIDCDDRADPTDSDGFFRSDTATSAFIGTTRTEMDRISVLSFDSTGFTGQAAATTGINSPQANYLALKFSGAFQMACANLSVAATTGDQTFTSFGFAPTLVFGMSHLMTVADAIVDGPTASAAGYFVTGSLGSRAYSVHNQEGLDLNPSVSSAHTYQSDSAVAQLEHTGTVALKASWVGTTATGFTLNFSTASQAGTLTALGLQLGALTSAISETETVTDSAVAFLNRSVAFSETETIVDSSALLTVDVSDTGGPAGTSFAAHAERGSSFSAGAVAGTAI